MAEQHRVLVVDDDHLTRWTYAIALQQRNLEVDVAESFREAMQLLDRYADRYCCVILDLMLSDGDGTDIAAYIQQMELGIPVVVVTGYPERPLGQAASAVRLVIKKPVEPQELSEYVHLHCPRWPEKNGASELR